MELESLASEILGHSHPPYLESRNACQMQRLQAHKQTFVSGRLSSSSLQSDHISAKLDEEPGGSVGISHGMRSWEGGQLICLPNVFLHPTTNQLRILAILPLGHNPLGDKV